MYGEGKGEGYRIGKEHKQRKRKDAVWAVYTDRSLRVKG